MAERTVTAADLSITDQARLTSGADFWTTTPVPGVDSIMMTDGPHGLRKQEGAADHLGVAGSVAATCFPPAVGLAQTWNPVLAARVGAAIGIEARAAHVAVVLGPGINLKRSPLGGRNFEYYSEDPLLTAHMGAAWVDGLQSRGVGASLKHFAVNNQETDRMRVSADVDDRTLHELYLRAFRHIVTTARPWTVMCSYNRINGVYSFANRDLLTTILRDSWGFDGAVVSDWGAVADRVDAVAAGLDLTMPFGGDIGDEAVAAAAADGSLDPTALRTSADRVIALSRRAAEHPSNDDAPFDADAHHTLAREVAGQAVVLLRNDPVDGSPLLPLDPGDADLAVIGALAADPRYQGGGSSHVNATRVDVPVDAIGARVGTDIRYAAGYSTTEPDDSLADEAVAVAREARTVVLVLGLADRQESEGFDRTDIDLPADQLALASRILAVNPRTVIVLCHGGIVRTDALDTPALLDAALLGQAVGSAIADVVFGDVNPSGRLAESIPARIEDTAAYLNFPGEHGHVTYGEGLFIGYRWYDARHLPVSFPFGFGLSYTEFGYSGLSVESSATGITATVAVTNTGTRAGREVIQVYVGMPGSSVMRPPRELKGFASVEVDPAETADVTIHIPRDDLGYWDIRAGAFVVEAGTYTVDVGASSRDIRLSTTIVVDGDPLTLPLTLESSLAEVLANPAAAQGMTPIADAMTSGMTGGGDSSALGVDLAAMLASVPIGRLVEFSGGQLPREVLQQILDQANEETEAGAAG